MYIIWKNNSLILLERLKYNKRFACFLFAATLDRESELNVSVLF